MSIPVINIMKSVTCFVRKCFDLVPASAIFRCASVVLLVTIWRSLSFTMSSCLAFISVKVTKPANSKTHLPQCYDTDYITFKMNEDLIIVMKTVARSTRLRCIYIIYRTKNY